MENKAIYPIRVVARRTGMSVHVIRAWERRYGAVKPQRTNTQRRLYSTDDIHRLVLLRKAVLAGNSIAQVSALDNSALHELTGLEGPRAAVHPERPQSFTSGAQFEPSRFVQQAVEALQALDPADLERVLEQAAVVLSRPVLIEHMILPLTEKIGRLWAGGQIKIVHEHAASAVLRHFLWNICTMAVAPADAPVVVAATPVGQWHEFGTLLALSAAVDAGWRGIYCGPNLPPEEIVTAVAQKGARAALLGVGLPMDRGQLNRDLRRLVRIKPSFCTLIVGGPGVDVIQPLFDRSELMTASDVLGVRSILQDLLIA